MGLGFIGIILAASVLSFPEAEGFGSNSVGGRGGTVYEVTNVNDSGAGSLRNCIEASGPRTCVFKTGGLISINSPLVITNPYITIAGQTAPGGGITIKTTSGGEVFLTKTHDVIMRYLTVRAGPGGENHANQIGSDGNELYNIMIDHSTFSWGVDSNIETWYRVKDTTIQWSLISEGLNNSTHSKGAHSKGLMIGGYKGGESGGIGSENISILNNVLAHNADRNPLMQLCGVAQVINNVTYNPLYTFSHQQLNCPLGMSYINWVNNYHKSGPSSTSTSDLKIIPSDEGVCGSGKTYMSGNSGATGTWQYSFSGSCDAVKTNILTNTPATAPNINSTNANDAYTNTTADGGAGNSKGLSCSGVWFNRRDSIDSRVINDVKNGTGSIIDNPSNVGGWITPAAGSGCEDTDHDGMPNTWEVSRGLNPNSISDGAQIAPSGYTYLEEYLNGMASTSEPDTSTNAKIGDMNNDNLVNIADINLIKDNYGSGIPNNPKTDINNDGRVNMIDIGIAIDNYD